MTQKSKVAVIGLGNIRDNGFEPVCIGGLDQSIRIEVFGDLHEFGALGKTVTVTEAKRVA